MVRILQCDSSTSLNTHNGDSIEVTYVDLKFVVGVSNRLGALTKPIGGEEKIKSDDE